MDRNHNTSRWLPIRRRALYILVTVLVFCLCAAFLYPQYEEQRTQARPIFAPSLSCDPGEPVRRVAIIGAGSAGSSTAYYLSRYDKESPCLHSLVNITVYERNAYIGGRSTTVNAHDSIFFPVELGASIFVNVNHNLVSAVKAFGLSTQAFTKIDKEENMSDLGVWDGAKWVFVQKSGESSWWMAAKLLWKYGMSPIRTRNLMKATVGKFLQMYEPPYFPFRDLSTTAEKVGLTGVTAATGALFLQQNGVGEAFGRDLIQASTRVNYAQDLETINGLLTMVCMATDGAMSVAGGNWQIFDGMVAASGAKLRLNTSVDGVTLQKNGTFTLSTADVNDPASTEELVNFDEVVLAAPYQYANLKLSPQPRNPPSAISYVTLHVTLFTSPYLLKPEAFNLAPNARVPTTILTTTNTADNSAPILPFFSISTLRTLISPKTGEREYLYKIFSPAPVQASWLRSILDLKTNLPTTGDRVDGVPGVTWSYEKVWQSYPVESPRVTFEDLEIELGDDDDGGGEGGRVWYTSGIEGFISTMETSSLMGMNVARLIMDGRSEAKEANQGWITEENGYRTDL